jgi:hypothetical protein
MLIRDSGRAASGSRARFGGDERGAILLMGVFMCACMVAILWYLAGIGDAIVYRERMQEAADAAVFSAAALNARGMNLIVMLNLIMACILAVRVVLKALQAGLVAAGAILAIFAWTGVGAEASAMSFEAAEELQTVITEVRSPINQTLKALSKAQTGIADIIPGASVVGSYQVGRKYRPAVSSTLAATLHLKLPVEDGTPERLCEEAAHSVTALMEVFMPSQIKPYASAVDRFIKKAVGEGQIYFCEFGLGSPPDFSADLEEAAKKKCGQEKDKLSSAARDAELALDTQCEAFGVVCDGTESSSSKLTPLQRAKLSDLKAKRDTAEANLGSFKEDKCVKDNKASGEKELEDKTPSDPEDPSKAPGASGSATKPGTTKPGATKPGGKPDPSTGKPDLTKPSAGKAQPSPQEMAPKKVTSEFVNGNDTGQFVGIARGNDASLKVAPRGVRAGIWNAKADLNPPQTGNFGFAQAEYFYDCKGRWTEETCNGKSKDGNAMWHFRWRARLRRFNAPFVKNSGLGEKFVEVLGHAQLLAADLPGLFGTEHAANLGLYTELQKLLMNPSDDLILH